MEFNTSITRLKIDENAWVMQIKHELEEREEELLRVSMFNVPKELLATNSEAYIPQTVSIGPYHQWRSTELYDMERYKVAAAHHFQKAMNRRNFATVVEEFQQHDGQIRSCCNKYISYKKEAFAMLMALNAAFLLEFLQFCVRYKDENSQTDLKLLERVLGLSGTSGAENAIIRDVMMLENQLPLFLLQKLLELQFEGSKSKAEEKLRRLLRLVCQQLSPFSFKLPEDSNLHIDERGHVLEVLYYSIAPFCSDQNPSQREQEGDEPDISDMSAIKRCISLLPKTLSSLNVGPIESARMMARRVLNWKPLRLAKKLRLTSLLNVFLKLPVLSAFKRSFPFDQNVMQTEGEVEAASSFMIVPPSTNELDIPSVGGLCLAGVKFRVADGDLRTIQFDEKTATLCLPKVNLHSYTEVIMRNLVAFEASAAPGALVFRRYIDFMNGIIDCEEDARLLRERGIISNYLQNDQAVASMWNSMGKCANPAKVSYLDKVVKDLNRYYKSRWKVIVVEFAKKSLYKSWKIPSLVAAAILLLLTCLEAFCSAYDCKKWSVNPSKVMAH